jgi:hypothetical protein
LEIVGSRRIERLGPAEALGAAPFEAANDVSEQLVMSDSAVAIHHKKDFAFPLLETDIPAGT